MTRGTESRLSLSGISTGFRSKDQCTTDPNEKAPHSIESRGLSRKEVGLGLPATAFPTDLLL